MSTDERALPHPAAAADVADLRALVNTLPLIAFGFDAAGVCTFYEGGLAADYGLRPGEPVGTRLHDLYELYPEAVEQVSRALRGETVEQRIDDEASGASLYFQWHPRRDDADRVIGMVAIALQAGGGFDTDALARARSDYRALLAAFPDHMFRLGDDGLLRTLKPANRPSAAEPPAAWVATPIGDVLGTEVAARISAAAAEVLAGGEEQVLEYADVHEGEDAHLEARVLPESDQAVLVVVRDVTERYRLEAELRQTSKLDALGQLSAGIAHEINTPVQFVSNNVEFMSESFAAMHELLVAYRWTLGGSDPRPWADRMEAMADEERRLDVDFLLDEVPVAVEETLDGMRRVARIVRAMKSFAHPSTREMNEADLNEAMRNAVVVSASEHKLVAEVSLELGELPPVPCVMAEISQVLLNLIVNAAQAVGPLAELHQRPGQIVLRSWREGDQVVLEVADDGPGVPYEERERIFDAFYTTKPVGTGTGQGLTLARSIVVDRHGGTLEVASSALGGAAFRVRLPLDGAHVQVAEAPAPVGPAAVAG